MSDGSATERQAAVAMLRQVCGEFGDNDWADDLHLADVIEKHLWRYLWRIADAIEAQMDGEPHHICGELMELTLPSPRGAEVQAE